MTIRSQGDGSEARPGRRRAMLDDVTMVKVTTRIRHGLVRDFRIKAIRRGITIEAAMADAVTAYLTGATIEKNFAMPDVRHSGLRAV